MGNGQETLEGPPMTLKNVPMRFIPQMGGGHINVQEEMVMDLMDYFVSNMQSYTRRSESWN